MTMSKRYSIAEARHDLAAIVHELEEQPRIELTRRGEPVAVLLSLTEYRRLLARQRDFWSAYTMFRAQFALEAGDTDELLRDTRDAAPGRELSL
jgi:cellobiose PTS system EIIB component